LSSIDPTLLGIFEAEQREHVERIRALAAPAGDPFSRPALEEVLRRAHTLKGAAHAVGLAGIERLTQLLEALFVKVRDGALPYDRAVRDGVIGMLDAAEDATAAVLARGEEPDLSVALRPAEALLGIAPAAPPPASTADLPPEPPSAPQPPDIVRVGTANVDQLVASSSQLLAAAAVQMRASRELDGLLRRIEEFEREWVRLRGGFSASPAEAFERLEVELRGLSRGVRAAAGAHQRGAWTLNRLAAEVYDKSCRVRMTPAETVFGMFRRMVRDLAAETGKQVDFRMDGMEVQADRLVLQALKDPVMHLLRNAVAHGIEPPEVRAAAGKPEAGAVHLAVESPGDRLQITVADDGMGIDLVRVKEVAVSRGLLSPTDDAARELDRLATLLMTPGFSTSAEVGQAVGPGHGTVGRRAAGLARPGAGGFPPERGFGIGGGDLGAPRNLPRSRAAGRLGGSQVRVPQRRHRPLVPHPPEGSGKRGGQGRHPHRAGGRAAGQPGRTAGCARSPGRRVAAERGEPMYCPWRC
jgi:two-component system, chemotaxis family, sensor kinase CheA